MALLVLPPDPIAVRKARLFVRDECVSAGVPQDSLDTAVLLTSELVTNAFTHGRSEARLEVAVGGGRVVVRVGDDNSRHPQPQTEDSSALDGRGLAILDACAQAWGVEDSPYGKIVWFALPAA